MKTSKLHRSERMETAMADVT